MDQVHQLDASLGRAVEAYNFATVKLNKVRADLKANHAQLQVAKHRRMTAGAVRLIERRTTVIAGLDRRPGRGRFVTSSAP